jgi:hypothetical protein
MGRPKGIPCSELEKARRREANLGSKNPMWGKHHNEETKKKIAIKKIGKVSSRKGIHLINEIKTKISLTKKGQIPWNKGKKLGPLLEEHKRKLSLALKGDKCYLWKGGLSFEPYGLEFNKQLKKKIRLRDSFCCQDCLKNESEFNKKLYIHHIDFNKKNNNPINLISLCNKCHIKTNFKREGWIDYYKNIMQERRLA